MSKASRASWLKVLALGAPNGADVVERLPQRAIEPHNDREVGPSVAPRHGTRKRSRAQPRLAERPRQRHRRVIAHRPVPHYDQDADHIANRGQPGGAAWSRFAQRRPRTDTRPGFFRTDPTP